MAGAGPGQGAEDRPAQADLHRRPEARLRAGRGALGLNTPPNRRAAGVVWDLGNVLVDWQPSAALAEAFGAEEAQRFLDADDFDFMSWNHGLDAGGSWPEAIETVRRSHPHWGDHVAAYREHFPASLVGEIDGTAEIVRELHEAGVPMWGLTNWSHDTYPYAPARFPILGLLREVVVSGTEGVAKPDPRIFTITVARTGLSADRLVFVDDRTDNVAAATEAGLDGIVFTGAGDVRRALRERGLPV